MRQKLAHSSGIAFYDTLLRNEEISLPQLKVQGYI
jgi:hypothetical protein